MQKRLKLFYSIVFQKAVNPIGEILSMKGKYHQQYDALYKNHSIDMDAHTVR